MVWIGRSFGFSAISLLTLLTTKAEPIRISPGTMTIPAIQQGVGGTTAAVFDKGIVHVIYRALSANRSVVVHGRVAPSGTLLSTNVLTETPSGLPDLIASKGRLFAVWSQREDDTGKIGFASSVDGQTWNKSVLPNSTEGPTRARLVSDASGNLIVYGAAKVSGLGDEEEVYCFRTSDGGESWTAVSPSAQVTGQSFDPFLLELEPSRLVMIWAQNESPLWSLRISHSIDGGQTWGETKAINDDAGLPVTAPTLLNLGKRLVVLWTQTTAFGKRLVMDSSADGGVTWGSDLSLSGKEVFDLSYQAIGSGDQLRIGYLATIGSGQLRRNRLFALWLDRSQAAGSKRLPEPTLVYESAHPVHFSCLDLKKKLAMAVSYRATAQMWKISLFFAERSKKSGDILRLAPDLGGRERTLLQLLSLPEGVGVLYREQRARRFPMEPQTGELWFERAKVPK